MPEIAQVPGRDAVTLRHGGRGNGFIAITQGRKPNRYLGPFLGDGAVDWFKPVAEPIQYRIIPGAFWPRAAINLSLIALCWWTQWPVSALAFSVNDIGSGPGISRATVDYDAYHVEIAIYMRSSNAIAKLACWKGFDTMFGPCFHHLTPPLEQITTLISRDGLIPGLVRQRSLAEFMRKIAGFSDPFPKRTTESMGGEVPVVHAA